VTVCEACGHENPADASFCNACGAPLRPPDQASERRKTVTVLFCDVIGSTALGERLDPESLRRVLARYFDVARDAVERHGGVVEKFIGDAVMAVFGVPQVHEDDALRAVRAAEELREGLERLNDELERGYGTKLAVRIGVNTGEVVTGTEERLATGDAVNVAARLEQAAEPGEILIGEDTLGLLRDGVSVEAIAPLELKGKAEAVAAYRLVAVTTAMPARRLEVPMVGRERQLRLLLDAFESVVSERSCHLFTVLGAAGVGKSRLVSEFLRKLDGATVLRGRCLSYGEGITYWPVVEVVKQAGGAEVLADEVARNALDAVLGETGAAATPDEIAWAFRKLLETRASEVPVVCLFDDIQWGENTFLDLVEHVADLSRGVPILLLCMARPELLDHRLAWGGGKLNATSVLLEPLSESETDELITRLLEGSALDPALQSRVRRAAGGNPLFVEEMLALVGGSHDGDAVAVPPTIQALLAARLDQLEPSERQVLERGSVEGEVFHRGSVAALSPDEPLLDSRLTALVRKDLLRPEQAQLTGDDGYRFRHLLIRDAAYEALPKATRADLHERFASWLRHRGAELVELDEIVGYHLEQSVRYRSELGPLTDEDRSHAQTAGELLARAGRKAHDRGDRRAAANLLDRARALLRQPDPKHVLALIDLGRCLSETGDDLQRSRVVLTDAFGEAQTLEREELQIRARLELEWVANLLGEQSRPEEQERLARDAIGVLERHGDDEGLARAWFVFATSFWIRSGWDEMRAPLARAMEHARRTGNRSMEIEAMTFVLAATMFGSTPVDDGIRVSHEILENASDSRELQGWAVRMVGTFLMLDGRFDEAREHLARARAIFTELGNNAALVALTFSTSPLERWAGDAVAAEREARRGLDLAQRIGDRGRLPNLAALLADALLEQGRVSDTQEYVDLARDTTREVDASAEALWRMAAARLLVRSGAAEDAVRLAQEAMDILLPTQETFTLSSLLLDAAEVLQLAGRQDDEAAVLREAVRVSERKGATVLVRRAQERLSQLAPSPGRSNV
jgi:class 3 adenylate cyclase/tetratricopeptide (TPR) repeat protein